MAKGRYNRRHKKGVLRPKFAKRKTAKKANGWQRVRKMK